MAYFRVCPTCGAALDPGEVCEDCREKEKTAADAMNTDGGEVQGDLTGPLRLHDNRYLEERQ